MGYVHDIYQLIQKKEISCVELVTATLARIRQNNDVTNAFIETFDEFSLKRAADLDQKIASGECRVGMGVPGIKDNMY